MAARAPILASTLPLLLLLLLAPNRVAGAAAAAAASSSSSEYDPVAPAAAVVTLGRMRLTVLTANLVRVEIARNATAPAWDDRATTSVVNRRFGAVPAFTVTPINASAATIATAALTITYVDGPGGGGDLCAGALNGTDAANPTRSLKFPDGLAAASQAACCAACESDASCSAWVFAPGTGGVNCWPLSDAGGTRAAAGRVLGGNAGGGVLPAGASLTVAFTGPGGGTTVWTPGAVDAQNLNGTYSALDCYSTPMQCDSEYRKAMQPGLLSRSGWTVLDDTNAGRIVAAPDAPAGIPFWWDSTRTQPDQLDVYLRAAGDGDHRAALAEWIGVLGKPPMLPRSAFGVWWSRYYPYTQSSIVSEVLEGYRNYSIPLNNLVFDMDWHDEPSDKSCQSWGNYDVNTQLFPDMAGFAEGLHAHGNVTGAPLKLSFNVHPQTGVDHCDSRYAAIATAMGIDPATNATVACDFGNKTFTDALFSTYYDAAPLHLVDVWWTDYGGCGGPSSLLWSNWVYYNHQKYGRQTRGQAFSRYGGTGNSLTPHGFSGDTFMHEAALAWEVRTTQTAANVLWGYWSHDIGGFHDGQGAPGDDDPTNTTGAEMFLRWVQFGAVAPILRTHCNHCERRIWMFPYFEQMRDAMRLRNALGPYIYSEARAFYDTGVAVVHPLYYDFPHDEALYGPGEAGGAATVADSEYAFGSAVLAAPITAMANVPNGTLNTPISRSVYLPSGSWSNWNGSAVTAGPATVTADYGVGDIPLFARAGALLPLKTMASVTGNFPDPLVWVAFPGAAAGEYTLYEDDGDSDAYQGGEFVTTAAAVAAAAGSLTLTVSAANVAGALPGGFPQARGHVLQVRGVAAAGRAVAGVTANGVAVPPGAGVPGWAVVAEAEHSLAAPAGALVVAAGAGFSSWSDLTVVVTWA